MDNITIRQLKNCELETALALVWHVFCEYEAPDYTQEGTNEFLKTINDTKIMSALTFYGAFIKDKLVGVIATRNNGAHIALFFVDGNFHRRGIGKRLFQKILNSADCPKLTVNSSPFAVPFYRKLGFNTTDSEQTVNGLRFTPMEYQINK